MSAEFELPEDVPVIVKSCDGVVNAWWSLTSTKTITLCHEMMFQVLVDTFQKQVAMELQRRRRRRPAAARWRNPIRSRPADRTAVASSSRAAGGQQQPGGGGGQPQPGGGLRRPRGERPAGAGGGAPQDDMTLAGVWILSRATAPDGAGAGAQRPAG